MNATRIVDCLPPRGHAGYRLSERFVRWTLLSAVLASVVLTWPIYSKIVFELVPTPGYLLNGSFEGRWVACESQPHGPQTTSHPRHIEFRITENVRLASWTRHPDSLSLEPGVFARGTLRSDGIESPCEFSVEGGQFLLRSHGTNRIGDTTMWMYANESRFTPTLWRTRSSDELDLTFSADRLPIRYVRDN